MDIIDWPRKGKIQPRYKKISCMMHLVYKINMKIAIDFDGTLIKRTGIPTKSFPTMNQMGSGRRLVVVYTKQNRILYIQTDQTKILQR